MLIRNGLQIYLHKYIYIYTLNKIYHILSQASVYCPYISSFKTCYIISSFYSVTAIAMPLLEISVIGPVTPVMHMWSLCVQYE